MTRTPDANDRSPAATTATSAAAGTPSTPFPAAANPAAATSSPHPLSRRTVLKGVAGAAVGATVAAAPVRAFDAAAAEAPSYRGIFGYGVASGDPTATSLVIWTRATPPTRRGEAVATPGSGRGKPTKVHWEVATDERFRHVVRRGHVVTRATSDHTVKVDVRGLSPYTRYWYRFRAHEQTSTVGRTQTAPDVAGKVHALRLALVSCSNYTGGYFTAYRSIGRRDDLDLVLHVGDYIYEYGNGADRYGPAELIGQRDAAPATETIDLAGYRLRHALHKADPDLQLAHRRHPWITIFDDHEVANNAWRTGAENHTSGTEGDFLVRRQMAYEAYLEWMPFRLPEQSVVPHQGTRFFKRFTFGALGDLSVLETRQNRSAQVDVPPFTTSGGGFIPVGMPGIDAALADPARHLPEPEQLAWLKDNVSTETSWHLIGNQVVIAPISWPGQIFRLPGETLLNSDQWDGYQADQAELLTHLAGLPAAAGGTVVLTGDIHSSWAIDLPGSRTDGPGYTSVGVEFVCPSVTSDGFYEGGRAQAPAGTPAEAAVAATKGATAALQAANPWLKFLDGVGHGYTVIDVTPERVQADYWFTPVPTSAQPDPRVVPAVEPAYAVSWQTLAGSRAVSAATGPVGARSDHPRSRSES